MGILIGESLLDGSVFAFKDKLSLYSAAGKLSGGKFITHTVDKKASIYSLVLRRDVINFSKSGVYTCRQHINLEEGKSMLGPGVLGIAYTGGTSMRITTHMTLQGHGDNKQGMFDWMVETGLPYCDLKGIGLKPYFEN